MKTCTSQSGDCKIQADTKINVWDRKLFGAKDMTRKFNIRTILILLQKREHEEEPFQ
jgi:hypothetical protein